MIDYENLLPYKTYTVSKDKIIRETPRYFWEPTYDLLKRPQPGVPVDIIKENADGTVDFRVAIDRLPTFQQVNARLYRTLDYPWLKSKPLKKKDGLS